MDCIVSVSRSLTIHQEDVQFGAKETTLKLALPQQRYHMALQSEALHV